MAKQAIKAGSAYVELYADDRRLKKSLKDTDKGLRNFAQQAKAAAVPLLSFGAAAASAVKHFADFGDQMNKMAARTGVTVEALSGLKFAADRSGTSIESLEKALAGMANFLLNAERGLSRATDIMKMLGLRTEDILKLAPEEQFRAIMRAIGGIEDPTKRAAIAMVAFGRAGKEMLPMIGQLDALIDKFIELDLVMSTKDAQAAADLTDALGDLTAVLKNLGFEIGSSVAPELMRTAQLLTEIIVAAKKFKGLFPRMAIGPAGMIPFATPEIKAEPKPLFLPPYKTAPPAKLTAAGTPLTAAPYGPNLSLLPRLLQQARAQGQLEMAKKEFGGVGAYLGGIMGIPTTTAQKGTYGLFRGIGELIGGLSNKAGGQMARGIKAFANLEPTLEAFSTAGTFSAFAVGGLGGQKGIDAVATNTRTLIAKQEKTIQAIENNAPQFA